MQYRLFFFVSILIVFLCSCSTATIEDQYHVHGTIHNAPNATLYLEFLSFSKVESIDTTTTDESGHFDFQGITEQDGFYRVRYNNLFWLFFLQNDALQFVADANTQTEQEEIVEGSEEAFSFYALKTFVIEVQNEKMALNSQLNSMRYMQATREEMIAAQQLVVEQSMVLDEKIKARVLEETNAYMKLYALSGLAISDHLDFIKKQMVEMEPSLGNTLYYEELKSQVELADRVSQIRVGGEAPDIAMSSPSGDTFSLHSIRGNVVLLDFWASWCKPCRIENPNVVRLYHAYKDKGFTVFSVSLDKDKNSWMAAIQQDGLEWPYHVSDLQFWNNAAAQLYGVQSIPQTFLLDENGIIVAQNLRGAALEEKLKELFD